jgi:hypothetical protein
MSSWNEPYARDKMSLYRIYIDETGNHDMIYADDPNSDKPKLN